MFKQVIVDLANSETKEVAILNSEKVRNEFNNLIQPIDSITSNREIMESCINMFIEDFDNPFKKDLAKNAVLMLRGFTQF